MPKRKLQSFIKGFREYHEGQGSPWQFAHWTALWCLSVAVDRNVWVYTSERVLYPNLFLMAVSPAGLGKSSVLDMAEVLLMDTWPEDHNLSSANMTGASFVDELRDNIRTTMNPATGMMESHNSLNVLVSDLQTMLPVYDTDILAKLTRIYDCKSHSESRRGGKGAHTFKLDRTFITMLVGTTPAQLMELLPESGWSHGFMSRTILVFSDNAEMTSLFAVRDRKKLKGLYDDLSHDLQCIRSIRGEFVFEDGAAAKADAFRMAGIHGGDPIPSHPRLLHYSTRRMAHLLKLMQLSSLDRDDELIILNEDYDRAYEWLIGAESLIPEIFKSTSGSGDAEIASDLHHELCVRYAKTGQPVPKGQLVRYLIGRTQAARAEPLIRSMIEGRYIKQQTVKGKGVCYVPLMDRPDME